MSEPQSAPQCTPEAESGETVRPRVHTQPAGQSTRQRAGNGRINSREVEREYKTRESDTTQLLLRCSTPELFKFLLLCVLCSFFELVVDLFEVFTPDIAPDKSIMLLIFPLSS